MGQFVVGPIKSQESLLPKPLHDPEEGGFDALLFVQVAKESYR